MPITRSQTKASFQPRQQRKLRTGARTQQISSATPASVTKPGPPAPLTEANLVAHTRRTNPCTMAPMVSEGGQSETTTGSKTTKSHGQSTTMKAERRRLESAHICVAVRATLPATIRSLVTRLGKRRKIPSSIMDPIIKHEQWVGNEPDSVEELGQYLTLPNKSETGAHKFVVRCKDLNLNKDFLPPQTKDKVAQLRPDLCLGYAMSSALDIRAFSMEEQIFINHHFQIADDVHFPFLTAQWKVRENHRPAAYQGARDGAAIVQCNRQLLLQAQDPVGSKEPSIADTCHFSITCEGTSVWVWVHWYDAELGQSYMVCVDQFHILKKRDMVEYLSFIQNLKEEALGARLRRIKAALLAAKRNSPKQDNSNPVHSGGRSAHSAGMPSIPEEAEAQVDSKQSADGGQKPSVTDSVMQPQSHDRVLRSFTHKNTSSPSFRGAHGFGGSRESGGAGGTTGKGGNSTKGKPLWRR